MMPWWLWRAVRYARGYRHVDHGFELSADEALSRVTDTVRIFAKGKSVAVRVDGRAWEVWTR